MSILFLEKLIFCSEVIITLIMIDPATISIILTAALVGIVSIATGRNIVKELYNSRFNRLGYRIIRYRPSDPEYHNLFDLLQSKTVLDMSTAATFVGNTEVTTNVVKCRVAGAPVTVRCRLGIQQDAIIYFIVWDPPIFRRKYGINYYRNLFKHYSESANVGSGDDTSSTKLLQAPFPLIPVSTSLLVK